jgi:hypothetical protein
VTVIPCAKCGASVNEEANFCPECGANPKTGVVQPQAAAPVPVPAAASVAPAVKQGSVFLFGKVNACALVVGIAAALTVIAAFMAWASVSIFGLSLSIAGTKGDGKITLVVGILGLILMIPFGSVAIRGFYVCELILGAVTLIVGGFHLGDKAAAEGIFITALAGLVWVIMAVVGVATMPGREAEG